LLIEPDIAHNQRQARPATPCSPRYQLIDFIADNTGPLLNSVRIYVQRMGLARGHDVPNVAMEVLQEVVIEALDHAERFDPTRQAMAWLLGIALNIIKRKKVELAKRQQRELSSATLRATRTEPLSDDELFDQLTAHTAAGPEQELEAQEQATIMLSLVSPEDQQVLRLAFLLEFEREALAKELGITPVAARVRLHRALSRLRSAWHKLQLSSDGDQSAGNTITGRSKP
jgi:RNA polymerase sigma factor (sigma-70 family)